MAQIGQDMELAAKLLQQGELVGIPTETVYGLAAKATDPAAVARIFEVKQRPSFDPLICHVASLEHAAPFVRQVPALARELAAAFWPGPLTMILPRSAQIPDLVTSGLDTVGIRVPKHPLTAALLARLNFPLAAPSANPFGYVSPTTALHVDQYLGSAIPYILDGGPATVGIESTIVGFEGDTLMIYRMGGMSLEQIQDQLPGAKVQVQAHSSSNPTAPGMLRSHYAPRIPFYLGNIPQMAAQYAGKAIGILSYNQNYADISAVSRQVLSASGDLAEAARRLFAALRQLDEAPIDLILAEEVPARGLGRAINDRLRRAAAAP